MAKLPVQKGLVLSIPSVQISSIVLTEILLSAIKYKFKCDSKREQMLLFYEALASSYIWTFLAAKKRLPQTYWAQITKISNYRSMSEDEKFQHIT